MNVLTIAGEDYREDAGGGGGGRGRGGGARAGRGAAERATPGPCACAPRASHADVTTGHAHALRREATL